MSDSAVKVFLSQPMSGYSNEAVQETRREAEKVIDKYFIRFNNHYEIVSTFYDQEAKDADKMRHPKIYRLGHALMVLANCDYIYFAGDWKNKRSCVVEFIAARMFGVNIIPSSDNTKYDLKIKITHSKDTDYEY